MAELDERECRICRGEDEPNRPLFHPCKCSGSIKYTHEDCLVNWLAQSGSTRCELCNHSFRFEPLYQPNTPTALPTREFLFGVLTLTRKALRTAARIILVFTVWLFLLPVGTCWIWYALFINSLSQLPKLMASRGPAGVASDAFYGFLLSAGIVFIFLGVSSLREYIRHFPPEHIPANDDDDPLHPNIDLLMPDDDGDDEHQFADDDDDDLDVDVVMVHDHDHDADDEDSDDDDHDAVYPAVFDAHNRAAPPGRQIPPPGQIARLHADPIVQGVQPQPAEDVPAIEAFQRHAYRPHPHPHPQQAAEVYGLGAHIDSDDQLLARSEDEEDEEDNIDAEVLNEVDELVRDTIDEFAGGDDSEGEVIENDEILGEDSDDDEADNNNFLPAPPIVARLHGLGLPRHRPRFDALGDERVDNNMPQNMDDFMMDNMDQFGDDDDELLIDEDEDEDDDEDEDEEDLDDQVADDRADGGPLFGLFDLDPDDVPLEEVVGLRGPIRNLFDNAGTVLISNAVFLCVFTLIPLLIGRLTLRLFSMQSFPSRLAMALPSRHDPSHSLGTSLLSVTSLSFGDVTGALAESAKNVSLTWLAMRFLGAATNETLLAARNATPASPFASVASTAYRAAETVAIISSSITQSSFSSSVSPSLAPSSAMVSAVASISVSVSVTPSPSPASLAVDQPIVSYIDNLPIVLLGYGMIALIAVAYIGVMSMLRQRYPRLDSPLSKQIARMLRYIATFIKIIVLIVFEFGIFPLGCGWWLDICTLDILGVSLQTRLAYCTDSPWACTGVHWILGIFYMVHISLFISLLREVVKPQLLWFLRNPDDPDFHPFRELVEKPLSRHARRMCLSVVIYVPLIIAIVYVPAQLCLKLLPNVFPFRSEDFSHILIDVPFGNLLIGPLIRLLYYGRPEVSLQKIVAAWVRWTSRMLGIEDVVVKDENDAAGNEGNGNGNNAAPNHGAVGQGVVDNQGQAPDQREFMFMFRGRAQRADNIHANHNFMDDEDADSSDEFMDDMIAAEKRWVRIRGAIMIVLGWATFICVESALIAVPTVIGRWLMGAFGLAVRHDLHPYLLGLNIVLLGLSGTLKIGKYMMGTLGTGTIWTVGMPYVIMALKGGTIMTVWLGMIPLATGLLFELIFMPIRVGHNETPYFCMHQDWALGLLLLKVWACIAMAGGLGAKWRERVMRARQADLIGMDQHFWRSMKEVVLPVFVSVVTALAVPYSFSRGLLPFLGASRWVCNMVYRYSYLAIACVYCVLETMRYSLAMLYELHDSIRDDKYLIGKRLYNFIDSPVPDQNAN